MPERAQAIANLAARILHEQTGRGPTKVRAYVTDDVVTVVLRGTLTPPAQKILASGNTKYVRLITEGREAVRDMMEPALIEGVEKIMKRRVDRFLGAGSLEPDIEVHTFLLG